MAWYAELKRKKWYCINCVDMIQIYKQELYNNWYNSLSEEQKRKLEEDRKMQMEKKRLEARMKLHKLLNAFFVVTEMK